MHLGRPLRRAAHGSGPVPRGRLPAAIRPAALSARRRDDHVRRPGEPACPSQAPVGLRPREAPARLDSHVGGRGARWGRAERRRAWREDDAPSHRAGGHLPPSRRADLAPEARPQEQAPVRDQAHRQVRPGHGAHVERHRHAVAPSGRGLRGAHQRRPANPMTQTVARRACRLTARFALVVATAAAAAALGAGPALAASPAPAWTIESFATPTNFAAADNARCMTPPAHVCDAYAITATNAGGAPTDGGSVTLTDTLPPGLTVQRVELFYSRSPGNDFGGFACTTVPLQCTFPDFFFNFFGAAGPDDTLKMVIDVTVDDPTTSAPSTNTATVSGGGAAAGSTSETGSINGPAPPFGVSTFTTYLAGIDGQPYAQAGGHPYELTTRIGLTNAMRTAPDGLFAPTAVNDLRDAVIDLPLGFMGSAVAAPTCTFEQISSSEGCPAASVVGRLQTEPKESQDGIESPMYNMVPEHGHAAEFGYVDNLRSSHVMYASVAPTAAGYVLRVTAPDIPQVALTGIIASFYGDPATRDAAASPPSAMFTNPSDCSAEPPATTIHVDSWQHPGSYGADGTPNLADPSWVSVSSTTPSVSGCDALHFFPTVSVQPDATVADSPSGLDFVLAVPQSEDPRTLSTPPLRTVRVTLPTGLAVDPSSAGGLAGCAPGQIALGGAGSPTCPQASKIGTVQVTTPLLPKPLNGSVYLATQGENPFHSLLALYVVVDDPATGIVVKIPGEVQLDPVSGQVTALFENAPQFPFSELRLHFKGGSRGVLATPEQCGSFTTTTSLAAWSMPDSGPPAAPGDSFTTGSGCASGFAPTFTAGPADPRAGTYSTFAHTFSRSDSDRELSKLSLSLPPGLLARLAGVATCPEAQLLAAARNSGRAELGAPSCSAASQIGSVQVGVGPGPTPLFVPGKVY
ncbi:MAG: hypothetical protein E6G62_11080, partial [Actinobacteria bacterium]